MPTFLYTARNEQGAVQNGQLDAVSEDDVLTTLQRRGLLVTSITPQMLAAASQPAIRRAKVRRRMHPGVSTDDHVLLCQQLATLVEAGVPLLKSLEVVSVQVESRRLLIALEEVRRDVAAGRTLRESLAKHPAVFSSLWLNLVETGEASGHLAESLQQLSRHFELAQHLQNETRTALTYPAFLCAAAVAVIAVFVYWLIPKFAAIFATMEGMEMPLLTRLVIGASEAARKYVVVIVGAGALSFYGLRRYLRTTAGRWMRDQLLLQLPLFKMLFAYIQLAEFSRGLSTLLESGVPLLSSLEILERSATNKVYGRAIGRVREFVKEGKPMAEPMSEVGLFPPMAVQLVQVGEEVGELGKMVSQMARHYEERVETFIARMTRLFEPIAIVVMGGLVLIIVLSIFMPIFKMATGMKLGA
ncbi:MAG: type II secretion system F family protein [Candidatus Omnitrophica bacterium]|nr:type II secretion system F family protein [Candidatus Omnitrophota bacterium]